MSDALVAALASGFVGTVLGALVTWAANWSLEKRRWAREDQIRFRERNLIACQDFAIAAVKIATYRAMRSPVPVEVVESFMRHEQLLSFLASEDVRVAAAKIRLFLDVASEEITDQERFRERLQLLRIEFDDAVRKELGASPSQSKKFLDRLRRELERPDWLETPRPEG
jgi:hypothetical protein